MQLPLCVVGLWQYARRGTLARRLVLLLAVGAIPLTYFGATAATYMPAPLLRRAFALFLVLLASYSAWSVMPPRPLWGHERIRIIENSDYMETLRA
jgi:uncharacterized protein